MGSGGSEMTNRYFHTTGVHKYDIFRHKVNLSLWSVVLTSDFAVIRTTIRARTERDAEQMTRDFLTDLYDIRLDEFTTEATELLRPREEE
jgi:hypothetical protein